MADTDNGIHEAQARLLRQEAQLALGSLSARGRLRIFLDQTLTVAMSAGLALVLTAQVGIGGPPPASASPKPSPAPHATPTPHKLNNRDVFARPEHHGPKAVYGGPPPKQAPTPWPGKKGGAPPKK